MCKHKIGIIGYGGFGAFLHHAWEDMEEATLVAVADHNPARQPDGKLKFYTRWQDLLEDPEPDIIVVATPPATHAEIACTAMEAGKHAFIEKPLATTLDDASCILATQEKSGRSATVDFMMRFNPLVETLEHITTHRLLGELRRVDVENYAQDSALPPGHWFWDQETAGGILIEHGVHFIDIVHLLTDQHPVRVTGERHLRNGTLEDQVMANVLYDEGLMTTHYHSFARPGFLEITTIHLAFDLGQVTLTGWIPLSGTITALANDRTARAVQAFDGFKLEHSLPVHQAPDFSRPEGWGSLDSPKGHEVSPKGSLDGTSSQLGHRTVCSGGIDYRVDKLLSGTFSLGMSKTEVYRTSLRCMMRDFIRSIDVPGHVPRVTLHDGFTSLEVAVRATMSARQQQYDCFAQVLS